MRARAVLLERVARLVNARVRAPLARRYRRVRDSYLLPRRVARFAEVVRDADGGRSDDERALVLCVIRNGAPYIRRFLEHHRGLGPVRFVFMLNDSTDGSEEILLSFPDITVLRCPAPYRRYENAMKRYLVDRYGRHRWCLFLDIDELFDFPGSSSRTFTELLAYLDARGASAVVTQMLDLFSDRPMSLWEHRGAKDFTSTDVYYELRDIEKTHYPSTLGLRNVYSPPLLDGSIAYHRKGLRWRVFGTPNGLTKVSLFKNVDGLDPFVLWHHCVGSRFADVSCVLLHYPFAHGFREKVEDAVCTERYGRVTTEEYAGYQRRLSTGVDIELRSDDTRRYQGCAMLCAEGFLFVSETYAGWTRGASPVPDA